MQKKPPSTIIFFQHDSDLTTDQVIAQAQAEFDDFVKALCQEGVQVIVVEDEPVLDTPDSIFRITGSVFTVMDE